MKFETMILVLLLLSCGTNRTACDCPMIDDLRKLGSQIKEIETKKEGSFSLNDGHIQAEGGYSKKTGTVNVKIQVPVSNNTSSKALILEYDGKDLELEEMLNIVKWCDLWRTYAIKRCNIPKDKQEKYLLEQKRFFEENNLSGNKGGKKEERNTPKPSNNNTTNTSKRSNTASCKTIVYTPGEFSWEKFRAVLKNGERLSPNPEGDIITCVRIGDTMVFINAKNEEKKIIITEDL